LTFNLDSCFRTFLVFLAVESGKAVRRVCDSSGFTV